MFSKNIKFCVIDVDIHTLESSFSNRYEKELVQKMPLCGEDADVLFSSGSRTTRRLSRLRSVPLLREAAYHIMYDTLYRSLQRYHRHLSF